MVFTVVSWYSCTTYYISSIRFADTCVLAVILIFIICMFLLFLWSLLGSFDWCLISTPFPITSACACSLKWHAGLFHDFPYKLVLLYSKSIVNDVVSMYKAIPVNLDQFWFHHRCLHTKHQETNFKMFGV
eukprot:851253_1